MPDDKPSGQSAEKKIEVSLVRFGGLPGLAIYLGIGALLHAMLVGPQFDWSSAWTWGWLLGWPVALFIAFWGFILGAIAVAIVCVAIFAGIEKYRSWRRLKTMRADIRLRRRA